MRLNQRWAARVPRMHWKRSKKKEERNDVHERSRICNDEEKIESWNREEEKRWKRDKIEKKKETERN